MKNQLLSPNLYTHPAHAHWLDYLDNKGDARKHLSIDNTLQTGCRMSDKNARYLESDEYTNTVHKLDLVSAAYLDVLSPCARRMIKKVMDAKNIPYDERDVMYTTGFVSKVSNTPDNRLNRQYYENGHYYFDSEKGVIEVGFSEVEALAHQEYSEKIEARATETN